MKQLFLPLFSLLAFLQTSNAVVDIYVTNIAFAANGYDFYTDYDQTTELNFYEGTDTLDVSQTYRFTRLPTGTAHPLCHQRQRHRHRNNRHQPQQHKHLRKR